MGKLRKLWEMDSSQPSHAVALGLHFGNISETNDLLPLDVRSVADRHTQAGSS